ncbi:cytochrome P450 [Streptomyces sporangiiformans]
MFARLRESGSAPIQAGHRPTHDSDRGGRPIPGLSLAETLSGLSAVRRNHIAFLSKAVQTHGDVFRMRLLGNPLVMLNHPDHVHRVLVENRENYDKENFLYRTVRPVLRNRLIGAIGGESWHRQRRLMSSAA